MSHSDNPSNAASRLDEIASHLEEMATRFPRDIEPNSDRRPYKPLLDRLPIQSSLQKTMVDFTSGIRAWKTAEDGSRDCFLILQEAMQLGAFPEPEFWALRDIIQQRDWRQLYSWIWEQSGHNKPNEMIKWLAWVIHQMVIVSDEQPAEQFDEIDGGEPPQDVAEDRQIPELSLCSGEWLDAEETAKRTGLKPSTLRNYRSKTRRQSHNVDASGLAFRHDPNRPSNEPPYYLAADVDNYAKGKLSQDG